MSFPIHILSRDDPRVANADTRRNSLGITTIPHWISYVYTQFTDSNILYDYGGGNGLMRAHAEGKSFFDFGIEQQASIIGDLKWLRDGYILPEGKEYTDAYKAVLEDYAAEMRMGKPK